jgi:hypothetical protein
MAKNYPRRRLKIFKNQRWLPLMMVKVQTGEIKESLM